MKIIGSHDGLLKPTAHLLVAGAKVSISSFSCAYIAGAKPICTIGVPPEFLDSLPDKQTDDLCSVVLSDGKDSYTMFTGYAAGPDGKFSMSGVNAGVNLIHPSRDLDQHRISAPNMHPSSVMDYSYIIRAKGDSHTSTKQMVFNREGFFEGAREKLPKQVVDGIVRSLKNSMTFKRGSGWRPEKPEKAIALLEKVGAINGRLRSDFVDVLKNSIAEYIASSCQSSFTSFRSIWDTLASIFANFGIILMCRPDGSVDAVVECSGFTPPPENLIDKDFVCSSGITSGFQRDIREVNMICGNVTRADSAGPGIPDTLATWPPKDGGDKNDSNGASLSLSLPGWLMGTGFSRKNSKLAELGEKISAARVLYAKKLFYLESNKLRTLVVSGPIAPLAQPGTVCRIAPGSAVKSIGGEQIKLLKKVYCGYLYQVQHSFNAQAKEFQTTMYFRNVSDEASGTTIDDDPIFGDVKPEALL